MAAMLPKLATPPCSSPCAFGGICCDNIEFSDGQARPVNNHSEEKTNIIHPCDARPKRTYMHKPAHMPTNTARCSPPKREMSTRVSAPWLMTITTPVTMSDTPISHGVQ